MPSARRQGSVRTLTIGYIFAMLSDEERLQKHMWATVIDFHVL